MLLFIIVLQSLAWCSALQACAPTIEINASSSDVMPFFIAVQGDKTEREKMIIDTVSYDIMLSGQFAVTSCYKDPLKQVKDIQAYVQQGYSLIVFLDFLPDQMLEWRLYDALDKQMLGGKKISITEIDPLIAGHMIATFVWERITAQQAPFMSMLAYIKKNRHKKHELYLSTFDGKKQSCLYTSSSIIIAPTWNRYSERPTLILSEFTHRNVRLKAIDLEGKSKVVLDVDGTHVGISYGHDHSEVVYCRSGEIWRSRYDSHQKKSLHQLVMSFAQPCSHPTLLNNGDIIYGCSGKIYLYKGDTGVHVALTHAGYCVAPAYDAVHEQLVYSKRIKGIMQLCALNLKTQQERQLTFDHHDKIDPCWSACGNYVAFCLQKQGKGRIVTLHLATGKLTYITGERDDCGYPSWSYGVEANCFVQVF